MSVEPRVCAKAVCDVGQDFLAHSAEEHGEVIMLMIASTDDGANMAVLSPASLPPIAKAVLCTGAFLTAVDGLDPEVRQLVVEELLDHLAVEHPDEFEAREVDE